MRKPQDFGRKEMLRRASYLEKESRGPERSSGSGESRRTELQPREQVAPAPLDSRTSANVHASVGRHFAMWLEHFPRDHRASAQVACDSDHRGRDCHPASTRVSQGDAAADRRGGTAAGRITGTDRARLTATLVLRVAGAARSAAPQNFPSRGGVRLRTQVRRAGPAGAQPLGEGWRPSRPVAPIAAAEAA
jgi:hypothetical protein